MTIGGTPVPWTDDAVSSYLSWRAGGEVAALELFSDGVDILRLRLQNNWLYLNKVRSRTLPSTKWSSSCGLERNYPAPFYPDFTDKISVLDSFNNNPSSQQAWYPASKCLSHSLLSVTRSLVRCFRNSCTRSMSQLQSRLEVCSLVVPSTSLQNQM